MPTKNPKANKISNPIMFIYLKPDTIQPQRMGFRDLVRGLGFFRALTLGIWDLGL